LLVPENDSFADFDVLLRVVARLVS
jgi:hypothetical protein